MRIPLIKALAIVVLIIIAAVIAITIYYHQ